MALVERKILRDKQRLGKFGYIDVARGELEQFLVVHYGRVTFAEIDIDGATRFHGTTFGNLAQRYFRLSAHFLAEGAQRAFNVGTRRNHVARLPAFEQAAFECAGFLLRTLRHVVVRLENEAHACLHGIGAIFGLGDMRSFAEERERAFACGGKQRARAACDLAFRQIGPQMKAENAVDVVFLEHPRFADELRATGGFLGGLEYDEHAALEFVEMRGDMVREAERHGHVSVVAAGVHLPGMRGAE